MTRDEPSNASVETPEAGRRFPVGPPVVPHRKNAAEWGMWLVWMPIAWVLRRICRTWEAVRK